MSLEVAAQLQMTGNSAPSPLACTASTTFSTAYDVWHAFSFNTETSGNLLWLANATTGWIQIDLGSSSALPALTQYGIQGSNALGGINPKTWTFSGSNDGSTWTTLDTQTGASDMAQYARFYSISPSVAYRFYRLTISLNQGSGSYCGIGQLYLCFLMPSTSGGGGSPILKSSIITGLGAI